MGFIVFILSMVIVMGVLSFMDQAVTRHRIRCRQLKAYIRFLESGMQIEDAHDLSLIHI